MRSEKLEFWHFVSKCIKCPQCPFYEACNEDKYSDETCADVLARVYEEKFESC